MFMYNKDNNLVTVSNSILKYFTGNSLNKTCKELDDTPKTGYINYSITFIIFIMLTMVFVSDAAGE